MDTKALDKQIQELTDLRTAILQANACLAIQQQHAATVAQAEARVATLDAELAERQKGLEQFQATFTGTGAIPVTIQVYTTFPQTGDNYARIGAPAGASISADIAAMKVDTAAVKLKTDSLTFTVAGQVDANIQSVNDVTVTGNGQAGTEWGP